MLQEPALQEIESGQDLRRRHADRAGGRPAGLGGEPRADEGMAEPIARPARVTAGPEEPGVVIVARRVQLASRRPDKRGAFGLLERLFPGLRGEAKSWATNRPASPSLTSASPSVAP